MEYYRFQLAPANRQSTINYEEIEQRSALFSTAAANCTFGVSFKRDGKKIEIEEIGEKSIILTLSSMIPLKKPSRSLYAFSRELLRLDQDGLLQASIYNHSLFSIQALENLKQNTSEITISDTQLMKATIDLLFSNSLAYTQNPAKREETIAELKKLLLPYIMNDAAIEGR